MIELLTFLSVCFIMCRINKGSSRHAWRVCPVVSAVKTRSDISSDETLCRFFAILSRRFLDYIRDREIECLQNTSTGSVTVCLSFAEHFHTN